MLARCMLTAEIQTMNHRAETDILALVTGSGTLFEAL